MICEPMFMICEPKSHIIALGRIKYTQSKKIIVILFSFFRIFTASFVYDINKTLKRQLFMNKKKVVITSGFFNPLHVGHLNLMRQSKSLGDFLVVIVNNDKQVKEKGSTSFMSEDERFEIIKDLRYVDEAFLSIDKDITVAKSLAKIAKKFKGNKLIFAKGGDRNINNIPESEKEVCNTFNIEVISNVGGGKVQSSSWIIKKTVKSINHKNKNED